MKRLLVSFLKLANLCDLSKLKKQRVLRIISMHSLSLIETCRSCRMVLLELLTWQGPALKARSILSSNYHIQLKTSRIKQRICQKVRLTMWQIYCSSIYTKAFDLTQLQISFLNQISSKLPRNILGGE